MDANAVLIIGAVVGSLAKFLSGAGLRGVWSGLGAFVVSIVTTWVWVFSHGGFSRASAWDDFAGFASVLLIAAGAFHVIENTPATASAVSKSITGDLKP